MCTVTFIVRRRGYCLGMNRDEKLTRPIALPPLKATVDGRTVLAPSEPGGGTWIAANDHGTTLALINWYSITARVDGKAVSRGEDVNSASAAISRTGSTFSRTRTSSPAPSRRERNSARERYAMGRDLYLLSLLVSTFVEMI